MENYVKDSAKRGHSMIVNRQKAYDIAEMENKKNERRNENRSGRSRKMRMLTGYLSRNHIT